MRKYMLILLGLIFSTSIFSNDISDKWFFSSINSNTINNTEFNDDDFLVINTENTFEYQITSKQRYAKGTWELKMIKL
jgi:hypothetical protein